MRRMGRVSSSKATLNLDKDDPQLGAWVEQDLEVVQKKMESPYADFTFVPPDIG